MINFFLIILPLNRINNKLTGCIHCNKISIDVVSGGGGKDDDVDEFLIAAISIFVASLIESFESVDPPSGASAHAPI